MSAEMRFALPSTSLFLVFSGFGDARLLAGLRDRVHESFCALWSGYLAGKYAAECLVPAVDGPRGIVVFFDDCAFQRQAGKHTLGARIRQHFGIHLPVGAGRGMTAHRTRSYRA